MSLYHHGYVDDETAKLNEFAADEYSALKVIATYGKSAGTSVQVLMATFQAGPRHPSGHDRWQAIQHLFQ